MRTKEIFISNESIADEFIKTYTYPYQVLPNIKEYIIKLGSTLDNNYIKQQENIWIHKNAIVNKSAEIHGPCIIDDGAEIRCNAYIRGNVIIGKRCVFGNSCEIKNSILYDYVQIPHFSYVGDSILGASSIISNLKSDKKPIVIRNGIETLETNLIKVGAFLGDYVEIGCGSILNPGTIIMPYSNIYPLTSVRGIIPCNSIVKGMDNIIRKDDKKLSSTK